MDSELQQLKLRIAQVYARREELKRHLAAGQVNARDGLRDLERVDRDLSALDTRFKSLWDAANARPDLNKEKP